MNKELLQKLSVLLKEVSPQEFWNIVKVLEEKLEGMEDSVEDLEQLVVELMSEEEDKSQIAEVALTKGLPVPDGGFVKRFMSLSFGAAAPEGTITKASRNKKKAEDYLPTQEEMSKINELTNVDIDPQSVYVFTLKSANQEIDRSSDQFTSKALKDMAEMSIDKPFLRNHDWSTESVIGKIFDAGVKDKQLVQKVYVPKTAKNADMIDGILTGIYNKVSVGFAMEPMDYQCSSCQKSLYSRECPHYPGNKDSKGELVVGVIKGVSDYFEISNVAVPAQPKAGIRRSAQKSANSSTLQPEKTIIATASLSDIVLIEQPYDAPNISETQRTWHSQLLKEAERLSGVLEWLGRDSYRIKDPITQETLQSGTFGKINAIDLPVDKILNENLEGASVPVEPTQEVNQEPEVAVLEEEKAVEAPEEKAVEAPSVEPEAEQKDNFSELLLEAVKALTKEVQELKATIESKEVPAPSVTEEVPEESTEDIARKVALTSINEQPVKVDVSAQGWSKHLLGPLYSKPNQ